MGPLKAELSECTVNRRQDAPEPSDRPVSTAEGRRVTWPCSVGLRAVPGASAAQLSRCPGRSSPAGSLKLPPPLWCSPRSLRSPPASGPQRCPGMSERPSGGLQDPHSASLELFICFPRDTLANKESSALRNIGKPLLQ